MQKKKENKHQQPVSRKSLPKASKTDHSKIYLALGFVLFISFIVYLPALQGKFVWDDDDYVRNNMLVHSINLKNIFFNGQQSFVVGNYHPLTVLMLAIEYKMFGVAEKGYHVVNLLFHLLNVLLVFRVVVLLSEKLWVGIIAALLFGIHPIHVESVAWISELKDLMYTFFFLSSYVFFLKYLKDKKQTFYYYALVLFLFSLLSKAMAASLPVLLILTDYFKGQKINTKSLIAKVPFFALAFIFGLIAVSAQKTAGATDIADFSLPYRIVFACYGFISYLLKLALPVDLCAYYPYPNLKGGALPYQYYLYVVMLLFLAAVVLYSIRYSKKIIFGFGFFSVTVFLVLQLMPVGGAVMADRYSYIPSIGIFYLIGEGLHYLWVAKGSVKSWKVPVGVAFGITTLFFCTKTYARCGDWKDGITLWSDVIRQYQTIAPAYINRGIILASQKKYEEALRDYNQAIQISPNFPKGYSNRGVLLKDLKRYDESMSDYNKAIALLPNYAIPYNNRGVLFKIQNKYNEALNDYNRALTLLPNYPDAYYNRAVVYKLLNKYDESLSDYNKALQLRPNNPSAYSSRAGLMSNFNKFDEALRDHNQAIQLQPDNASFYSIRASFFAKIKKYPEALNDYNRAISIQPSLAEAYYGRGIIEFESGNKALGCSDFQKAAGMGYQPAVIDYKKLCF